MAKALVIKGYTSEQMKAEMGKNEKYKIFVKLHAIYHISKGVSSRKLVDFYGFSFSQILNWAYRFEAEGVEGLKDKNGRGRKPKLTGSQLVGFAKRIVDVKNSIGFQPQHFHLDRSFGGKTHKRLFWSPLRTGECLQSAQENRVELSKS